MQILCALVVMYVILSPVYCELCQANCRISRLRGLRIADCFRNELIRIPQCLPGNIEVLDLSHNRIRDIFEDDFKSYSYLEILYLADNILSEINVHALEDLTSLHTLDLSSNPFYEVPSTPFSLPVLRKLLLGQVRSRNLVEDIESSAPITSPLIHLDLSHNRLKRLPILGEVPSLEFYNVSGNERVLLNTTMFAGLCNLREFIATDFSAVFDSPCDCYVLEQWLTARRVNFAPFNCGTRDCTNQVPTEDLEIFNNCRKRHEALQQQMQTRKLLTNVGISMGTILLFLLIVLYFIIRRKRARKHKKKMEARTQHLAEKKTDDLL